MAIAGSETTIVQPYVWYAPRLTVLPGPKHGFRVPFPAPWKRLENFDDENAVVVDFNNPKIRVRTQDHGVIATNPSNDDAISISVATQTPSGDVLTKALSLVEYIAAEVTTPPGSERPAITSWWFDPNAEKNFMFVVEGFARGGGIFDDDTKVYFAAYNVEPGEQAGGRGGGGGGGGGRGGGGGGGGGGGRRGGAQPGQITMNYKGENAHLQVALQLDCQPEPGIATVFPAVHPVPAEAAWPQAGIDPFKRANFWNVESIA